jgi:Glycosyltransferases involved in cell wall biogenesis
MKVSIVIPTYNCADLVGTTLRSIQQGGHDDLEVILMDGGSKDDIAGVVASFGVLVTVFVSEPDDGQYDAINKGHEPGDR